MWTAEWRQMPGKRVRCSNEIALRSLFAKSSDLVIEFGRVYLAWLESDEVH